MQKIEFFRHNIGVREIREVSRVLRGLFLTTGREVERFEKEFAAYLDIPHVVGVTSCTAALQLTLTGLGVGPGDEVITTPMTFAATALAVMQASAVPVFVDVEPETGNLDAELIEEVLTPRTKAILPVHHLPQAQEPLAKRTGLPGLWKKCKLPGHQKNWRVYFQI